MFNNKLFCNYPISKNNIIILNIFPAAACRWRILYKGRVQKKSSAAGYSVGGGCGYFQQILEALAGLSCKAVQHVIDAETVIAIKI
jgi:hypothetical protein